MFSRPDRQTPIPQISAEGNICICQGNDPTSISARLGVVCLSSPLFETSEKVCRIDMTD